MNKLVWVMFFGLIAAVNVSFAEEMAPVAEENQDGAMVQEAAMPPAEAMLAMVDNKFCPVSKEAIDNKDEMVQVEHNGKMYNLCCKMCMKDFNKDPDKYSKMIDDMMLKESEGANADSEAK